MDKKYFNQRLAELETAYNNIKPLWQDLADHYLPRQARFLIQNVNKAPISSKKIKDSSPVVAVRNFSSGMMSGATSPSRKWFKLSISNDMSDDYAVKSWCAVVSTLFRDIFNASNIYQILPTVYKQLGVFGISAIALEKDFDTVFRTKLLPIGSYRIAKDYRGKVDTLYRVYMETANNLKEKFGEENLSDSARNAVQNNRGETLIECVHAVEPNKNKKNDSPWAKDKKFISVYYEKSNSQDKFLSKGGFDSFPYIVFEADVNGEDVYPSDSPGIIALPDVKQLMAMITEYGKAVKKMVSPPLKGPSSLKNKKLSDNPGAYNPEDDTAGRGLSPIYEVNPRVLELKQNIEEIKNTVGQIFYNDLFAMMVSSDRRQITATEIDERREEKMVLLSPLLEQIHSGLKDLMDWMFLTCLEAGIIPPPPEQIQGAELKIEFVSTLAQAQKAANIGSMERFVTFVANMSASIDPDLRLKLNGNEIIDDYADYANIEPDQVVPSDVVEKQKAMIAQQQAQQQAMANVQQGSEIVKNMGGTDSSGGNLLERLGIA